MAKIYTPTIELVEIPNYLKSEFINYTILVNEKIAHNGKLKPSLKIEPIEIENKDSAIKLIIKINSLVVKRLSLDIGVTNRKIPLKSTISQTIKAEENIQQLELKLNIYKIDKKSIS